MINANTGIQLEEAGGNSFFGCGFENIAYGCASLPGVFPCINDPPTAIFIRHSGPGNGPNNTADNTFYGTKCEANALDLHNENPSTVIFGGGVRRSRGDYQAMMYPPMGYDAYGTSFNKSSACCLPG